MCHVGGISNLCCNNDGYGPSCYTKKGDHLVGGVEVSDDVWVNQTMVFPVQECNDNSPNSNTPCTNTYIDKTFNIGTSTNTITGS